MEILRNIPKAEVLQLANLVSYADGQVVSKTLVQNDGIGITLFAFAKDERITIDGKDYELSKGDSIVMPANHPHAVYGVEPFKMLLVVAFPA